MTDTTTLAPTDAEIWREWELILATSNPTAGTAPIKLVRTAIAKWGAPAPVGVEPVAWAATSTDGVVEALGMNQSRRFDTPLFAAPPAQEARVPLTSKECRDMLEEVDHYNFAIDLIRAVEKHHGITAQKETPC